MEHTAIGAKTKPPKNNTRRGTRGESKRLWRDGKSAVLVARLAEAGIQHSDFIGSQSVERIPSIYAWEWSKNRVSYKTRMGGGAGFGFVPNGQGHWGKDQPARVVMSSSSSAPTQIVKPPRF